MLHALAYDRRRASDAEDTIRFDLLRLYKAGMIESSPPKIIAKSTDRRFLNEVKRRREGFWAYRPPHARPAMPCWPCELHPM
jgi:hypothetical protein